MTSRLATPQEFEDAFEELFRQSPMPKLLTQRSILPRQSPIPRLPPVAGQTRPGVKTIFDMMKLRNTSMSSDLNLSLATSSTNAGGEADLSSAHSAAEKENKTPEKEKEASTESEVFLSGASHQQIFAAESPEERAADLETLRLASKLSRRLHSPPGDDSDGDDSGNWDAEAADHDAVSSQTDDVQGGGVGGPPLGHHWAGSRDQTEKISRPGSKESATTGLAKTTASDPVSLSTGKVGNGARRPPRKSATIVSHASASATSTKVPAKTAASDPFLWPVGKCGNGAGRQKRKALSAASSREDSATTAKIAASDPVSVPMGKGGNRVRREESATAAKTAASDPVTLPMGKGGNRVRREDSATTAKTAASDPVSVPMGKGGNRIRREESATAAKIAASDPVSLPMRKGGNRVRQEESATAAKITASDPVTLPMGKGGNRVRREDSATTAKTAASNPVTLPMEKGGNRVRCQTRNVLTSPWHQEVSASDSCQDGKPPVRPKRQTANKILIGQNRRTHSESVIAAEVPARTRLRTSGRSSGVLSDEGGSTQLKPHGRDKRKDRNLTADTAGGVEEEESFIGHAKGGTRTRRNKACAVSLERIPKDGGAQTSLRSGTARSTNQSAPAVGSDGEGGVIAAQQSGRHSKAGRRETSQKDSASSLSARRRKRLRVIEDSTDDEGSDPTWTEVLAPKKGLRTRSPDDTVDVVPDVIPMTTAGSADRGKDLLSLESSSQENEEVEEDVILFASKKSQNSTTRQGKWIREGDNKVGRPAPKDMKTRGDTLKEKNQAKKRVAGRNEINANIHKVMVTRESKVTVLKISSWSLQPVSRLKSVRIEGKLPQCDYFWLSSAIVDRVSQRIVKSTTGSLYHLTGSISSLNTLAAGFSKEVVQLFKNGFPADWRELLEPSLKEEDANSTLSEERPAVAKSKSSSLKPAAKSQACDKTPLPSSKHRQLKRRKTEEASPMQTPKRPSSNDLDGTRPIWTPTGVVSRAVEAKAVSRTKSGRAVIPPLAIWAGQTAHRDAQGNVTLTFASQFAEQHFAKLAQGQNNKQPKEGNSAMSPLYKDIKLQGKGRRWTNKAKNNSNASTCKETAKKGAVPQANKTAIPAETSEKTWDLNPDEMAAEVMAIVNKSKEKRLTPVPRRATCYSDTPKVRSMGGRLSLSRSLSLSLSLDFKDEEEGGERKEKGDKEKGKEGKDKEKDDGDRENLGGGNREKTTKALTRRVRKAKASVPEEKAGVCGNESSRHSEADGVSDDSFVDTAPVKRNRGGNCLRSNQHNGRGRGRPRKNSLDGKNIKNSKRPASISISQGKQTTQNPAVVNERQLRTRSTVAARKRASISSLNDTGEENSSEDELSRSITDYEQASVLNGRRVKESADVLSKGLGVTQSSGKGRKQRPQTSDDVSQRKKVPGSAAVLPEEEDAWTKEEIAKLNEALQVVSCVDPCYWEGVSERVGSKTAPQCAAFHMQDIPDPRGRQKGPQKGPQDPAPKPSAGDKPLSLRGKRGTLKRRREVRAILEHGTKSNDDYQDDFFDSTPFRNRKPKWPNMDLSKTDEEVFGRNPFFTPSWAANCPRAQTPASIFKASEAEHTSPWRTPYSAKKRDLDQYIYQVLKDKKQPAKAKPGKKTPSSAESSTSASDPTKRLFSKKTSPSSLFRVGDETSQDDEEEADYYFSDKNDD